MPWTYWIAQEVDENGDLTLNVDREQLLRQDPGTGKWQNLDQDGSWQASTFVAELRAGQHPNMELQEETADEMARSLWAATLDGDFTELPAEPRLPSYDVEWQYCLLLDWQPGSDAVEEAAFAEADDLDLSRLWFARRNLNHWSTDNLEELTIDGVWRESRLMIDNVVGNGDYQPPIDAPTDLVARLIDRAAKAGRLRHVPDEPRKTLLKLI